MSGCGTSLRSVAAVACVLVLPPLAAEAELLVYEPFDYTAGAVFDDLPAAGLNLTGNYTTGAITGFELVSASPGLSHGSLQGDLPAVAGNRLSQVTGTTAAGALVSVNDDVGAGPGEEIYFSALFTFSDALNGNHLAAITFIDGESGDQIGFGEAAVGVRAIRVWAQTAGTGGALEAEGADGSFIDGQTLWLIGRYFNSATPGGDTLELVGYDTAVAQAISPTFDRADANAQFAYLLDGLDIDLAQITQIEFTIRGTSNNFIDELRIGESYADVAVPEPVALVVLGVGFVAVAVRRGGKLRRA